MESLDLISEEMVRKTAVSAKGEGDEEVGSSTNTTAAPEKPTSTENGKISVYSIVMSFLDLVAGSPVKSLQDKFLLSY